MVKSLVKNTQGKQKISIKPQFFLDKKVKRSGPDVREAFASMGNEGDTSFQKEGSELIGLDKEVAIESG